MRYVMIKNIIISVIFLATIFYVWPKKTNEASLIERKNQLTKCMKDAEDHYNNSAAALCNDTKMNCKLLIGLKAPKLLEPLINTLNNQTLKLKTFSHPHKV